MKQAYEFAALIVVAIVLGAVGTWLMVSTINRIEHEVSSTLSAK